VAKTITKLEKILGYQFQDPKLLELALKHRSVGANNNERLEYLGDAVLGFIVADLLYIKFPNANEGELSRLRAHVVKGVSLADVGQELSLSEFMILGPGELKSGGLRRKSIIADMVESLLGAIYLDSGEAEVRATIIRWFSNKLEQLSLQQAQKDPKTRLQELMQSRHLALPEYSVTDILGKEHEQQFEISCLIQLKDKTAMNSQATSSSRRKAEQQAAEDMLSLLLDRGIK